MGIGFSHGDAHWSYGGFMRFRTALAAQCGIALYCMESFAYTTMSGKCKSLAIFDHREGDYKAPVAIVGIQPVIKWSSVHDDIVPLLNHSDCDGELTPEECKQVSPRLRELVKDWDDRDYNKIHALALADGMDEAVEHNEPLEFY